MNIDVNPPESNLVKRYKLNCVQANLKVGEIKLEKTAMYFVVHLKLAHSLTDAQSVELIFQSILKASSTQIAKVTWIDNNDRVSMVKNIYANVISAMFKYASL